MSSMTMGPAPVSPSGMMSLISILSLHHCRPKNGSSRLYDNAFKKESGLLEYLTEKGEKDVMVCGIMTDFCINATVEAGFEHGLHMIVPAYANSTQDNEYMTGEQSYHYYNEFLWPDCYADCVPMDKALELLKK
mgnify:CR=1 FL=1